MACLVEEALMRLKRELAIPVPTGAWMSAIHGEIISTWKL